MWTKRDDDELAKVKWDKYVYEWSERIGNSKLRQCFVTDNKT